MVDLVQWLTACLDADAVKAQAAIDAEFITCGQWLARGPYGDGDRYGNIQSELNEQIIEHDLLWPQAVHIVAWDPARVLREIDAKRRVVEEYKAAAAEYAADGLAYDHESEVGRARTATLKRTLRLLALPYVDREGYRTEWAPTD